MVTSIKCSAPEVAVRKLDEHSSSLGDLLSSLSQQSSSRDEPQWGPAADSLHLAAGVLKVDIDPYLFNDAGLYCEPVGIYHDAKRKTASDCHTEMTRFLFTWNALETIATCLRIKKRKIGIAKAIGTYLARRFEPQELLHYECAIRAMKRLTTEIESPFTLDSSAFEIEEPYGSSGTGVKVVTQLRNALVHTGVELCEPHDWGGPPDGGVQSAKVARRLVLYTAQMMLAAHYAGSNLTVRCYDRETAEASEVEIGDIVRRVHLESSLSIG